MTPWQRIGATEYRLDDVWTVRLEPGAIWRAYRGQRATLCGFPDPFAAQGEAERLREEDRDYR